MMTPRAAFAAAVRPFAPGGRLLPPHIAPFDALADALGLPSDGAPPMSTAALASSDFEWAAAQLGGTVAQIRAVDTVESGGGWFADMRSDILDLDGPGGFIDGARLPKILFEAHIFDRETNGRFRKAHPNISSATWNRSLYVGGQGEWARLHRAMLLDRTAALRSASVGRYQIMGFNHRRAGFDTVEEMWEAHKQSERRHLEAFVSFIRGEGMVEAFRRISNVHADCIPFARVYNGPGYARHDPPYHIRLARAHAEWVRA